MFRGVAQMVARLVRDQEAVGSNPATPTTKSLVYQRFPRFTRDYNFAKKSQKLLKFIIYADNSTDNFFIGFQGFSKLRF